MIQQLLLVVLTSFVLSPKLTATCEKISVIEFLNILRNDGELHTFPELFKSIHEIFQNPDTSHNGALPIHWIILQDNIDETTKESLITALLTAKTDINKEDIGSNTPLFLTLMQINEKKLSLDFLKFMLASGASILSGSSPDNAPIPIAIALNNRNILETFFEHDPRSALFAASYAIAGKNFELVAFCQNYFKEPQKKLFYEQGQRMPFKETHDLYHLWQQKNINPQK